MLDQKIRGTCFSYFAFDIGSSIDLDLLEKELTQTFERQRFKGERIRPKSFQFSPLPLEMVLEAEKIKLGSFETKPFIELTAFDFGAVSVSFQIPFDAKLEEIKGLSHQLYDDQSLEAFARQLIGELLLIGRDSVKLPFLSPLVEDYHVFQLKPISTGSVADFIQLSRTDHKANITGILRGEVQTLSDQEVLDAVEHYVSYGQNDVAFIDWHASVVMDADPSDMTMVLEFANVALLELRFVDEKLDRALQVFYDALPEFATKGLFARPEKDLRAIGLLQVECAVLYEEVTNALKLFGDQYLARVYQLSSKRLSLSQWNESVARKLKTLESLYDKITDFSTNRKMQALEITIIILFVVSIVIPFVFKA